MATLKQPPPQGIMRRYVRRAVSPLRRLWSISCVMVCTSVFVARLLPLVTNLDPAPFRFPPLRPLPSDRVTLTGVELLFEGDSFFKGPESFLFNSDGSFYTGLSDGTIVRVVPGGGGKPAAYTTVARTGRLVEGCGKPQKESLCGRPLGLRADPSVPGAILVADAYLGLMRVMPTTGAVTVLVDPSTHNLTLVNDLEVSADGSTVYFTNTGRFPRNAIHKILAEGRPTGSLLSYHLPTGRVHRLLDNLVMPNGLTLTHDGKALLVCSTFYSGIYRVELPSLDTGTAATDEDDRGNKQDAEQIGVITEVELDVDGEGSIIGEEVVGVTTPVALGSGAHVEEFTYREKLVQNDLQGTPDNIRRYTSPDGNVKAYLVALGSKRASPFSLPQMLAPFTSLRRVAGLLSLNTVTSFIPRSCLIVMVDDFGKEIKTFEDPTARKGGCYWPSEAEVHDGWLYLGSFQTPFLARARASSFEVYEG